MIFTLSNNRQYSVTDTGKPYQNGEYPSGGFKIRLWHNGQWIFLDHSPNMECVNNFLKAAARLEKIEQSPATSED